MKLRAFPSNLDPINDCDLPLNCYGLLNIIVLKQISMRIRLLWKSFKKTNSI